MSARCSVRPGILPEERFNPCCIGLIMSALGLLVYTSRATQFQSLLYWIDHVGLALMAWATGSTAFQSLLYWIDHVGLDPIPRGQAELALFQSLLYWIDHVGHYNLGS